MFDALRRGWARVQRFIHRDLWDLGAYRSAAPSRQLLLRFLRTVYIVIESAGQESLRLRAAALTYTSLLSLVPALAVVFSIFTAFGGLRDMEAQVKSFLFDAVAGGQRDTVLAYLDRFVSQTNAGSLGAVGFSFLFITVLSLLASIEQAFNDIWGVGRPRSWMARFQVYWPLLTLAPILLGASLSITATVQTSEVVQRLTRSAPSLNWLARLGPFVLTSSFFMLLYKVMPHTKVGFRFAAIGGLFAGGLWVTAQKLYALYASNAISYATIYGSLAAVPLFIVWIYVSWLVVLVGASLTFAAQSAQSYEPQRSVPAAEQERIALLLCVVVANRYLSGGGATTVQQLLDAVRVQPRQVRRIIERLAELGVLQEALLSEAEESGYLLGRPPGRLRVYDILSLVRRGERRAGPARALATGGLSGVVGEAIAKIDRSGAEAGATTLEELAEQLSELPEGSASAI